MTTLAPLLLALPLAASAAAPSRHAPGLDAEGDFCEVVFNGESWERVSCFVIEQGPDGVSLRGQAYSWLRTRDDGTELAPSLASWELDRVVSYGAVTKTLVYEHKGKMTNTGTEFTGQTSISFDFGKEGSSLGWYGDKDAPTRFRMLPLVDLEACLEIEEPSLKRLERWERVATSSKDQLKACVAPPPAAWVDKKTP